jgi:hypothetical protein
MNLVLGKTALLRMLAFAGLLAGCNAPAPVVPQRTLEALPAVTHVRVALDMRRHSEWTPVRRFNAQTAVRVLENVLNSPGFSRQLSARRDLQRAEGLSGAEILRIIRSGTTLLSLHKGDSAIPKSIELAMSISPSAIEYASHDAFTDLDTGIIYARSDWLDTLTPCRLAGLLAHEYMHVIGFTHTTFNHPWRRLSVPYAIGDMVTELSEASLGVQCTITKS